MRNAVFLRDLGGRILIAADERRHFDVGNSFERIEMFLAERALPRYANSHFRFSKIPKIVMGIGRHCEEPTVRPEDGRPDA